MADGTKIEWTDATVNAINGCTVVSPGCTNCYAMRLAGTRLRSHPSREGLTQPGKAGPVWNGVVRLHEPALSLPRRWRKSRMIFWNAHGDMFHPSVPVEWIDRCFDEMEATRHHVHQVLTKRPERMAAYIRERWALPSSVNAFYDLPETVQLYQPRQNIWLGTSIEDQERAEERVPHLLNTPAAVRWLSCEPLLAPIDLTQIEDRVVYRGFTVSALTGWGGFDYPIPGPQSSLPKIHWVVAGGESGRGARPMSLKAARSLRDQCREAQVPFLFKQWGNHLPAGQVQASGRPWAPLCGTSLYATKGITGRLLDGCEHNDMPRIAA
ncbi:MAG: phage Gp37/Gp68 family protein [Pseudomonadota bacterium]